MTYWIVRAGGMIALALADHEDEAIEFTRQLLIDAGAPKPAVDREEWTAEPVPTYDGAVMLLRTR